MSVTVFGIGYVGLVQAAVLSEVGHNVCCVDIDGAGQIKLADPLILSPLIEVGWAEA